jgi:hypothetical protein
MSNQPEEKKEPEHNHEPLTSCKMAEIADQMCEFIWNYDITINEARIISNLIPTFMNEMLTRIAISKDGEIELSPPNEDDLEEGC